MNWQILPHGIWCHKKFPGPNLTSPLVDLIWTDCMSRLEGWQHPLWRRMGEEKKVKKFPREMGYTQIWFHSLRAWWMRDSKAHKRQISIPIWRFYGLGNRRTGSTLWNQCHSLYRPATLLLMFLCLLLMGIKIKCYHLFNIFCRYDTWVSYYTMLIQWSLLQ